MTGSLAPEDAVKTFFQGVELVIFDFDGVIADSEVISLSTLHRALADFGCDMPLSAVRERFLGTSVKTILQYVTASTPTRPPEEFRDHWQAMLFAAFRNGLSPVSGVERLLDRLRTADIRFCIASSSSFERLDVALKAMGLSRRFENVFSAQQVENGKPAPDLFLLAAEQLNVCAARCVVIEDSPFGVRAANAAKMRCAGFVGGTHLDGIRDYHGDRLVAAGAELILDGFARIGSEALTRKPDIEKPANEAIKENPSR